MRPTRAALVFAASGLIAGSAAAAARAGEPPISKPRLERPSAMTKANSGPGERPATVDGQRYRGLDDYLAKLERDGWVGKAWYRQVRPGLYELVTNLRPPPERRLFTRVELARKFGFIR